MRLVKQHNQLDAWLRRARGTPNAFPILEEDDGPPCRDRPPDP
jgi:hypothetical protein